MCYAGVNGVAGDDDSICEQCGQHEPEEHEEDCTPYHPPEYHSLLRQPPPPPISGATNSGPRPSRHMSSFKPQHRTDTGSSLKKSASSASNSDHIPRSHERLPYRSSTVGPPPPPPKLQPDEEDEESSLGTGERRVGGAGSTVPSPALYIPEPEHDAPEPGVVPVTPEPPVRSPHASMRPPAPASPQLPPPRYQPRHSTPASSTPLYDPAPHSPIGGGGRYDSLGRNNTARYDSGGSSRPYLARRYEALPPEHYEQIQQDILESEHSQSSLPHRSKRRRRKQRSLSSQHNTDQSSNGELPAHTDLV